MVWLNTAFCQVTGSIVRVWLEHNVTKSGNTGIMVHAHFNVQGMKNKKVDCTAYFYDENKDKMLNSTGKYRNTANHVCTWSYGNVTYDNAKWDDYQNFIPYNALTMKPGSHTYYCKVCIYDSDNNLLDVSDYVSFQGTGSNTKRINYNDGSYADVTNNPDGSITTSRYSTCIICRGTKICKLCHGQGGFWGGFGQYRRYSTCNSCGGARQCMSCMGTGVSVLNSTYYPATGEMVSQDLWSGRIYTSGGSNRSRGDRESSSSSSRSGRTSASASCSICHGTGFDPFAWESPAKGGNIIPAGAGIGYTSYEGDKCPYCSKYVWHQHSYCPKCNADKYR